MTPQELKNSIFHLAFRGKLVPQIESETITDDTAFLSEEAPFDVPESWSWNVIGECCEMYTGNSISESIKKAKYEGLSEGYDYIGTKDVSFDHTISYDNGVRIPFKTDFKIAYKDAILMCIEGGSAGRKIAILDRDVCFGNKLCMFRAESVSNTYLYYYLQSMDFKNAFMENMTGIIGGVSIKKLKSILLPVPPVEEQNRIVEKIEEILPLVNQYEQAWAKLEEFNARFPMDMQKSILQMAIQGKLVPQDASEGTGEELYQNIQQEKAEMIKEGKIKKQKPLPEVSEDEIPFDIPETWRWCRLLDLCSLIADIDHNMPKAVDPQNGVLFLSAKDLLDDGSLNYTRDVKYISENDYERLSRKATPQRGDIIYSRIGAALGKARVVERDIKFLVSYSCCTIRPIEVSQYYLRYYLESPLILQHSFEARQSTGVPDLGMGEIKKYIVALPPLSEQNRIVKRIEELLPICKRLELSRNK